MKYTAPKTRQYMNFKQSLMRPSLDQALSKSGSFGKIGVMAAILGGAMGGAASADGCGATVNYTVTCNGDLSGGVTLAFGSTIRTANIQDMTANIGANGIKITSADRLNLNVDTGIYAVNAADNNGINIQTWGTRGATLDVTGTVNSTNMVGIYASTVAGDLNITTDGSVSGQRGVEVYQYGVDDVHLTFAGSVSATTGKAVYASGNGNITLDSTATITSGSNGVTADNAIKLDALSPGNIVINQTGDVFAYGNSAIQATASDGNISVTSDGTIRSDGGDGMNLNSMTPQGDITVNHTGSITASNDALDLGGNGDITVNVTGDLTGFSGITATSRNYGDIDITHDGDITATNRAIVAQAAHQNIIITNTGDISSGADAINAQITGAGSLDITQDGTITSIARGIYAYSATGLVDVISTGTINASGDAVSVAGSGERLHVGQTGNLTSTTSRGVTIETGTAEVLLDGAGTITGSTYGVYLYSTGTSKTATFKHTSGTITATNGTGVYVQTSSYATGGDAVVDNAADVVASGDGISAQTNGQNDTASILQHGNVTANTANSGSHNALYARSATGNVSITGEGDIVMQGSGDAIRLASAASPGYTASVDWKQNVTAIDGAAVSALVARGAINFDLTGNYSANARVGTAGVDTISAKNYGDSNIDITVDGTVTRGFTAGGITGAAISAIMAGNTGTITINTTGTIQSSGVGISVSSVSQNAVNVDNNGTISAGYDLGSIVDAAADAIRVLFMGTANVDNSGDLTAANDGINVTSTSGGQGMAPLVVTNNGKITAGHDGIHISSVDNGSVGSVISATTTGDITAQRDGIYAQTSGQQNINVTVNGGTVFGESNAVEFSGGQQNVLTNYGTLTSNTGDAILANNSDTTVENYGTIKGNVYLERTNPATNLFNNHAGAEFDMGANVNLGEWNQLVNDGLVKIGNDNAIATTALRGALVNNADGTLAFDINMTGETSDKITITDGDATLGGKIALHFTTLSPATQLSFTLVQADDGVTLLNGLTTSNPFINSSITNPDGQSAVVTINGYTFAPSGMVGNAKQMGAHLSDAMSRLGTNLGSMTAALVNIPDLEDGQDALAQMSPEAELGRKWVDTQLAGDFGDMLVATTGDRAAWVRGQTLSIDSATGDANSSFSVHGSRLMAGGQTVTDGALKLGLAVGVSNSDLTTDTGATSSGQSFDLGAVVKYESGPITLAAALSGGHGSFASARYVSFEGFNDSLTSERSHDTLNVNMRASYLISTDRFYLRPSLGLNEAVITTGAGTETGGDAALTYDRETSSTLRVSPALEVGLTKGDVQGWQSQSWLRVTHTFQPVDAQSLQTAFVGADGSSNTATVTGLHESAFTTLALGVDLHSSANTDFQLSYDTRLGDVTTYGSLSAKFSMHF